MMFRQREGRRHYHLTRWLYNMESRRNHKSHYTQVYTVCKTFSHVPEHQRKSTITTDEARKKAQRIGKALTNTLK
jgi:hypothetical protein